MVRAPEALEAPFNRYTDVVRPEWIDYSGHMNLGYYLLAFEEAATCFFGAGVADLGEAYRERTGHALFAAETHITFDREVRAGDPLRFESYVLDATDKAIDCMHLMYHGDDGYLAATNQLLYLHVDLDRRRVAAFGDEAQARIDDWRDTHAALPRPEQAGRAIGLRKS
jgi:acyl-CoA thioester hydrolase